MIVIWKHAARDAYRWRNVVSLCRYSWFGPTQLEHLIEKNYYLHRSAKDAYASYLKAYASHALKNVSVAQDCMFMCLMCTRVGSVSDSIKCSIFHFT